MGESLKDSDKLTFVENLLISGTAAVIAKTAAAPIERIKLNIQNQDEMLKQGRIDRKYDGIIDCTKRIAKAEGILAFWRGNGANVIRYFPTQALNFAFLGKIKDIFKPDRSESYPLQIAKNVASGGVAGSSSLLFVYSLDYARTRLANDAKSAKVGGARQFNGLIDVFKKTYASDGMAGLYRGFLCSCFGVFVYRGLYFGLYDTAKPIISSEKVHFSVAIVLAYFVTVFAGIVSYPVDTVRRRMMMTSGESVKYKNSFDCLFKIIKSEGAGSLFKGVGANVLRGIAGALVISGFDEMRDLYIRLFKQRSQNK